ncbi:septum site-determining protein Ssd [Actinomadura gamaensis]|uniref:Septum site-determining protein Ssd n=1 Tax=Actinomadura gamaensis TaxID=1763541 RepID=A0ABV9TZH7_9ACTN
MTAALIVTEDPSTADDLLRLAAAADAPAEVVGSVGDARAGWYQAPLVLVGADVAGGLAAAGPHRRSGVVLVARPGEGADVYRLALGVGAGDVAVLPDDEPWLTDAMAAAAEPADARGVVVCVTGARGGAGASVLATALAYCSARDGLRTLLVDGDPLGGGVDLLLGIEGHEGARWPDLAQRQGRISVATLRDSLPSLGELSVLSWGKGEPVAVAPEAVRSLLGSAARGYDLTVVDVPRYLGDIGRVALRAAHTCYLVVPAEVRATVAADVLATYLRRETADVRLVIGGQPPGDLRPDAVARHLALPSIGTLDRDRRVPPALEHGGLPRIARRGPLRDLCDHLLDTQSLAPAPTSKAA